MLSLGEKRQIKEIRAHKAKIISMAWSEDGRRLATAAQDGTIKLWSTDRLFKNEDGLELRGHRAPACVSWQPASNSTLISVSLDGSVRRWDANKGQEQGSVQLGSGCLCLAWLSGDDRVLVGTKDNKLHAIETLRMSKEWEYQADFEFNDLVCRPPQGILLACLDGKLRVFCPEQRTVQRVIAAHPAGLYHLANGPRALAVGSGDAIISGWNPDTWCAEWVNYRLEWPVRALSWHPQAGWLAAGGDDAFIEIFTATTGLLQRIPASPVYALAWHPRQALLAYGQERPNTREGILVLCTFTE